MGPCASVDKKQNSSINNRFPRYTSSEIYLLELMFNDIASRASKPGIIREHFDNFFHLNGLWGDEMFKTFDTNHDGFITFEQFLTSIDIMVKGTFQQKSKVLFNFYDNDKSKGISYSQLVKMLFSYPKGQLNRMVTQEKFLQSIDDYQKNFYFHPQKLTFKDVNVVEQQSEDEEQVKQKKQETQRIFSVNAPSIKTYIDMKEMQQMDSLEQRKKELIRLKNGQKIHPNGSDKKIMNQKKLKQSNRHEQNHFQSIVSQSNLDLKRKKYVVRSNIASLVRKYATFLFEQFKIDIKKQQISFEQFKQLIKNHSSIFNSYFQGFHSYIWQFDDIKGTPQFRNNTAWVEGPCHIQSNGVNSQKYLYFSKTTIIVLNTPKSNRPIQIINMQGLSVEEVEHDSMHGFAIKHRDGIYPEKKCLFQKKQTKQQWMLHLAQYKSNNVYDCFTFLEKVGEGNFSSVYSGVTKTQVKQQVAIKVIKKFELSLNQKNVIKSQCNILELCHHPNIVKLFKIFNTRSHIYIVSQYLGQGDLFQYVKKNTFLQQYQSALIMKQLVQVVKYFSMVDLIHRDLKPQNVMIIMNKDKSMVQKIKIIDFGFAVYKSNLKNLDIKEKYAGTPGFMSPEIVNCEEFDQSVDIFSLGVILYFMLCGSLPFFSTFLQQIVQQTKQCNIVLKNAHWNNISQEAKDLVYKMITFKNDRINLKQLVEHPWLKNIEQLKKYNKINKKNRYI